jgi:GNAT superfamily N-acetyltransferase
MGHRAAEGTLGSSWEEPWKRRDTVVAVPRHPLADLISAAAAGRFPPVDGCWERVPLWRPGLEAVVAFTGHAALAIADDVPDSWLDQAGVDGFGGAHDPRMVAALAGPGGWIDSIDLLLAGLGTSRPELQPPLVDRADLVNHPRALHAAGLRTELRILGYPDPVRSAVAIVSRGVAGLTELSFELEPDHRGAGGGTALIRDAVGTIPAGDLIISAVAPGNSASLRALLGAGFVPLASMQLFRRG